MKTKLFLVLILFLFTNLLFSQTYTERYNELMHRYEYYDSNGSLIGYKTYNELMQRWEFYSADNNYNDRYKPYNNYPEYKPIYDDVYKLYEEYYRQQATAAMNTAIITFWTNYKEAGEIKIYIGGAYIGTIDKYFTWTPDCTQKTGVIKARLKPGVYKYKAVSKNGTWEGTIELYGGDCATYLLKE